MKNRGIRVAMISEHASPVALLGGEDAGGQNVYVDELSRQLARAGFMVDVFTRRESAKVKEINQWADGARVINVTAGPATYLKKDSLYRHMPEFRDNMVAFADRERARYDVIHAHFWMSGWVACEIKQLTGIPLAQTFHALGIIKRIHQGQADTSPSERFDVERRIVREADRIIATCPAEQEDLQHFYDGALERISVIPCGVNTDLFRPINRTLARAQLDILPGEKAILYVGRVLPRKGIDNIISGTAELAKRADYPLRLIIVGGESDHAMPENDEEMARLARIADELGIRHLVEFTGRRPQKALPIYYSACDVCVTTPWYEPFGMVPLEAMACGAQVIAAEVGGLKFSVVDEVTGFLVPSKDPVALANKLEMILGQDDLRQRLGSNAQKRVERWFTWSKVADRIAAVYEEITRVNADERASPLARHSIRSRQHANRLNATNVFEA